MPPTPLFILSPSRLPSQASRRRPITPRRPPRCCEPTAAPTTLSPSEEEALFTRLKHVNKNLRKKASASLAEAATPATIARLVDILSSTDITYRRAAVQALSMTGMRAIPPVLAVMCVSDNPSVRASCAKMLASVALYFPERRVDFPADALDAMHTAAQGDPSPVTRLAAVGTLGVLGCDAEKEGEVLPGCETAVEVLIGFCKETGDMAVAAAAVSAVTQIGQNGTPERKGRIVEELRKLAQGDAEDGEDESGFNYVREIAASNLDQLEGGTRLPDEDDK